MKDAEEMIWSPSYGLKGVVDASVESRIIQNHGLFSDNSQWVLPMEIKTGRATNVSEHRAQTILYTLLMSERYGKSSRLENIIEYTDGHFIQVFKCQQGSSTTLNQTRSSKFRLRGTSSGALSLPEMRSPRIRCDEDT